MTRVEKPKKTWVTVSDTVRGCPLCVFGHERVRDFFLSRKNLVVQPYGWDDEIFSRLQQSYKKRRDLFWKKRSKAQLGKRRSRQWIVHSLDYKQTKKRKRFRECEGSILKFLL